MADMSMPVSQDPVGDLTSHLPKEVQERKQKQREAEAKAQQDAQSLIQQRNEEAKAAQNALDRQQAEKENAEWEAIKGRQQSTSLK